MSISSDSTPDVAFELTTMSLEGYSELLTSYIEALNEDKICEPGGELTLLFSEGLMSFLGEIEKEETQRGRRKSSQEGQEVELQQGRQASEVAQGREAQQEIQKSNKENRKAKITEQKAHSFSRNCVGATKHPRDADDDCQVIPASKRTHCDMLCEGSKVNSSDSV